MGKRSKSGGIIWLWTSIVLAGKGLLSLHITEVVGDDSEDIALERVASCLWPDADIRRELRRYCQAGLVAIVGQVLVV